jgi:hypothetical protein
MSRCSLHGSGHAQLPIRVLLHHSPCAPRHQVSCSTSRVVPEAHRVVGSGTHQSSGPRDVHTTVVHFTLLLTWHSAHSCQRGPKHEMTKISLLSSSSSSQFLLGTLPLPWMSPRVSAEGRGRAPGGRARTTVAGSTRRRPSAPSLSSARPPHVCSRRRQSRGRRRRWLNSDLHDDPVHPSRLFLLQMKPGGVGSPPTTLARPREPQWHASGREGRDGLPLTVAQDTVAIREGDDGHGEGAPAMGIGEVTNRHREDALAMDWGPPAMGRRPWPWRGGGRRPWGGCGSASNGSQILLAVDELRSRGHKKRARQP